MLKRLISVILILLGIAGFLAIPYVVGFERALDAVYEVGVLCAVLYMLTCALTLIIPAVGWYLLMRADGIRVSILDTFRANFMGFPINLLTPSLYIGGEPLKAFFISNKYNIQTRRVLALIIVGKFQELAGLIFLIIICSAIFIWKTELISTRNEIILIVMIAITTILFSAVIYAYAANFKPLVRLLNLIYLVGFPKRKIASIRSKVRDLEQLIHDTFIKKWKIFLISLFITIFSAVSVFVRPFVFFSFAKNHMLLLFEHACAIFTIINIVNLFQIIPANLGVFDGTVFLYFSKAGLGEANAAAYNIVSRISDLALFVFGAWLITHYGLTSVAKERKVEN